MAGNSQGRPVSVSSMKFRVSEHPPSPTLVSQIEEGPQEPCLHGHEMCSFRRGGPCLTYPCTCETDGRCISCNPGRTLRQNPGRIP